jgi:hypothetical protein
VTNVPLQSLNRIKTNISEKRENLMRKLTRRPFKHQTSQYYMAPLPHTAVGQYYNNNIIIMCPPPLSSRRGSESSSAHILRCFLYINNNNIIPISIP